VARLEPWREEGDDDALALAVKHAGEALAERMGWHPTRADYTMARVVILSAREWLEAPLKKEVQRLTIHREAVVKMLRMVCEEFGDNDWPDNLHQADVIEKHLIRPIRQDLQAQEAEIAALGEQVAALREELAKNAARHWTEAVEAEYLRLAARVALDVALGSKSWSLGMLGQEEVEGLRRLAEMLGVDPDEADPLRSDDGWKVLQKRAEEAEARVATLEAENRALTASLRASNATTRAAQGRAEKAERLFRERNQPREAK